MADVDTGSDGGGKKKGAGPKTKKKSTHIDMTAMVDVAFLLLTFFVLTATMSNSAMMELTMPPEVDEDRKDDLYKKIKEDKIMTLVLYENDEVKYYVGITEPDVETTNFGPTGVRKVIEDHINAFEPLCDDVNDAPGCWDPIFVIKARDKSRYKNLVDLLDELAITEAPKYAIDEFTTNDSLVIDEAENRVEEGEGEE